MNLVYFCSQLCLQARACEDKHKVLKSHLGDLFANIWGQLLDYVHELGSLISANEPIYRDEDQITIADLTGVAVQDIQIAKAVYEECERIN